MSNFKKNLRGYVRYATPKSDVVLQRTDLLVSVILRLGARQCPMVTLRSDDSSHRDSSQESPMVSIYFIIIIHSQFRIIFLILLDEFLKDKVPKFDDSVLLMKSLRNRATCWNPICVFEAAKPIQYNLQYNQKDVETLLQLREKKDNYRVPIITTYYSVLKN